MIYSYQLLEMLPEMIWQRFLLPQFNRKDYWMQDITGVGVLMIARTESRISGINMEGWERI